jgi:hypothetical protein
MTGLFGRLLRYISSFRGEDVSGDTCTASATLFRGVGVVESEIMKPPAR